MTTAQNAPTPDLMEQQRRLIAGLRPPEPRPRHDYPGVTSYYEVRYAQVLGYRPLTLDLHVPEGSGGPFPVIVWAHGGAFRVGSRAMGHTQELAQHGYAVAAVDYRLSGEAKFPAPLHDLKAAVRWLRGNAPRYRLDPERIAGWGASAGAFLINLLALTPAVAEFEGEAGEHRDQSSAIQAVVDFFGPSDFLARRAEQPAGAAHPTGAMTPEAELLGFSPSERPDEARRALPVSYCTAEAPPFLIMHGDVDPMVPHRQSELLHEKLKQAGADSTLVTIPGALHEDPRFWESEAQATILAFLGRALASHAAAAGAGRA